jgi:5-methylcytosine-specific restriction endonuclease McrA
MKVNELLKTIKNITHYTGMSSGTRDRIREIIRIYHNHRCSICKKYWVIGERRFDIHHKDCDNHKTRQIDREEDLDNLILICHNCHLNLENHKYIMSRFIDKNLVKNIKKLLNKNYSMAKTARILKTTEYYVKKVKDTPVENLKIG